MSTTTETIHVSAVLPAKPKAVYDAWIDGGKHAAMTGAAATSDPRVLGRFTAWDGYIEGSHLEPRRPSASSSRGARASSPRTHPTRDSSCSSSAKVKGRASP